MGAVLVDAPAVLPVRKTSALNEPRVARPPAEIRVDAGGNAATLAWTNAWTVAVTWCGRGEREIVGAVARSLGSMLEGRTLHYFVCDTLAVRGYDMSLRQPANAVLGLVRAAGMEELVVVAANPALRMLAYALGLAVARRTRVFETREQAIAYCSTPPGG